MMKRLVTDESLHDGPDICLADLLRAARPLPIDPFCKRRILVRLERALAPMCPRFWVRPAVVAALLVSGSAAAALGRSYCATGFDVVGLGRAEEPTASS